MKSPHTIPDLKKQVREEIAFYMSHDVDPEIIASDIVDRTLAFAKEATLLEKKEIDEIHIRDLKGFFDRGYNDARQAQLKKWEELSARSLPEELK